MEIREVENTVRQLCAEASATRRDQRKFKSVLIQLREFMREHIDVVGLAYEDTTLDAMRAFLKKHPVSYPIALVDVYSPPKDFETPAGLPTTWLIAPDGKVAKRFIGPVEVHDIEAATLTEHLTECTGSRTAVAGSVALTRLN